MAEARYDRLCEQIASALAEEPKRKALYSAMKRGRDSRNAAVGLLPGGEAFRDEVRSVKLRCLEQQDELLERFAARASERGASVTFAENGPEAIAQILSIARLHGAKTVAKSKSLTSEEIEVNKPMEDAGMEVIETDLGELILQKVSEKPFHLVFPAVHKTAAEVAQIFSDVTGKKLSDDVDEIMEVVRQYLRPIFLNADIGMTGANVGIAENGAIVIETNEGNARLVSNIPDVHICIMGREKVVDTVEDALCMMLAHPISSVGQHLTTYVTTMAGRCPLGEEGGPRESHIIILDNGRSRMREDPVFSDALNCIRCGACMNICPTYGVVGGHSFGHIYPGPIGIPWTAQVHGLEIAGDFAALCVSCGLCKEICPVAIDIPMMISAVKDLDSVKHPHPRVNRILMEAEGFSRAGSATAPVSNWFLKNRGARWAMEVATGIDRGRRLPPFSRNTLFKRIEARGRSPVRDPVRRVVYFVDLYANYNDPDLGMAVVEALEAARCEVILPPQRWSGYPYIGYGDLEGAGRIADENVRLLAPFVAEGYDIIATEPTAGYCLKVSYPQLLRGREDARACAEHTFAFFEYLESANEGDSGENSRPLDGRRLGVHVSCHQRPLGAGQGALDYLRRLGAEAEVVESGTCCGMAGTFGLKKGVLGTELAQVVGKPLFDAFTESGVDAIATESSVCRMHLEEGTGLPVYYPLEVAAGLGAR